MIGYDRDKWNAEKGIVSIPDKLDFRLIYNDNKRRAAQIAERNMKDARIDHLVEFQVGDFAKIEMPDGGGVVMINPPYGERIGDVTELADDYERIGDFFKQKCVNFKGYVMTANKDLAKNIGLRPDKRLTFYNAKLEAKFLEYSIYEGSRKHKKD